MEFNLIDYLFSEKRNNAIDLQKIISRLSLLSNDNLQVVLTKAQEESSISMYYYLAFQSLISNKELMLFTHNTANALDQLEKILWDISKSLELDIDFIKKQTGILVTFNSIKSKISCNNSKKSILNKIIANEFDLIVCESYGILDSKSLNNFEYLITKVKDNSIRNKVIFLAEEENEKEILQTSQEINFSNIKIVKIH